MCFRMQQNQDLTSRYIHMIQICEWL